jgi:hypothetical protein
MPSLARASSQGGAFWNEWRVRLKSAGQCTQAGTLTADFNLKGRKLLMHGMEMRAAG